MTTATTASATTLPTVAPRSSGGGWMSALATLARRRFALSARTPREIAVPLLTPIFFAIVIAPALATIVGNSPAGIGVIVDRESGAQRDLLAAPIPRSLIVLGNLLVALVVSSFQLIALFVAALLRGADFHTSAGGILWFVGAAFLFAVAMYGVAETLANRLPKQEEYVGALPAIAILPWFFAGSLFPISALPSALTAFAKVLPLTHALALWRYGLVDRNGTGLHEIWGMSDPNVMAALSLAVVAAFAVALTALSIRVFTRAAVR